MGLSQSRGVSCPFCRMHKVGSRIRTVAARCGEQFCVISGVGREDFVPVTTAEYRRTLVSALDRDPTNVRPCLQRRLLHHKRVGPGVSSACHLTDG